MKIVTALSAVLLLASCATVQQNIDARAYLARCQFDYAGVSVTGVTFSSGVLIDRVDLAVRLKITNPTDRDVALDHAQVSLFLDKNPVLDLAHQKFTRVATKTSVVDTVAAGLPFGGIVKTLGHRPERLGVKAKLWVTLLVGKDTWETPLVVPVDLEIPVPYDQIESFVEKRKKDLEAEAADRVKKAAEKAAASAKKLIPSITP